MNKKASEDFSDQLWAVRKADSSVQAPEVGTRFELEITEKAYGGENDVKGEISAAQRSCPPVGGIPLHYLPLVLGREVKRG